ncbi:BnaC02g41970D [Brassica napus]|uniref:BnaC02g41970D protein n=1 Tax=Brassica napus TaxID=3708 RepID=A0A078IA61_BRANA|nr:BnaC02g41970D [Brassica napus]
MAGESRKRKVGLLYDERMCKHDTPDGEDHPECPNRIKAIWAKLQLTGLAQRCAVLGGSKAEDKHLQLVHTKEHVNLVKRLSTKKKDSRRNKIASKLDSVYLNGGSSEAAYLAAGSVVEVAEKVAEGELDRGFAIVRPPGHHAEADEAMGPDLGVKKILIVDWDCSLFIGMMMEASIQREMMEIWEGFNINVPWEQGRRSGFDAAVGDPRGGCFVTPYGYSVMLKKLRKDCDGIRGRVQSWVSCKVLLEEKQIEDSFEEYPYEYARGYAHTGLHLQMSYRGRQKLLVQLSTLEVALEEKAALQTKVAELQGEKLRLQDKYAAVAKEAAEQLTHVSSELREAKIDLDFQRELFKKASEEKKLLEGRVLKLEAELQKEASDKLRLRISRDRYAAEVKEAAEQLAKVRSELREVQIDLNLHRELLKKATEVK